MAEHLLVAVVAYVPLACLATVALQAKLNLSADLSRLDRLFLIPILSNIPTSLPALMLGKAASHGEIQQARLA